MSQILSVGTWNPPYIMGQNEVMDFARQLFEKDFDQIDRLLNVFNTGQIDERYFSRPLSWFKEPHSFQEKNDIYREVAAESGVQAIKKCLENVEYLGEPVKPEEVDALIFVSSTGLSTPSLDVSIINELPFNPYVRRMPLWGLGCAGGTAGLARADEYCRANPKHAALVLSVELCSLTFQHGDKSKSNLIGASLFADGAACVLVCGDESPLLKRTHSKVIPKIVGSQSVLMPHSEDVMGWDIRNEGLFVVFAKSIPAIVSTWFKPIAETFIKRHGLETCDLTHFVAHPGGRKVLEAYSESLCLENHLLDDSSEILRKYGNMSSPTVLFVLDRAMKKAKEPGEKGITVSLGPGFTAELLMLDWVVGV
jgi:alkylresorcinol/alkylpyrone synthase